MNSTKLVMGAYFRYSGHPDDLGIDPLSPPEAQAWMGGKAEW